ncbi:hypothetical protein [Rubrobacter aplysinae]|uniref:hypothetical protein n=1 Tax=Rubrobacter aplysinae TaxID=909625 RepID=UPI00128D357A|nr:hypothetical protein [Rubrobacter aplysinae]
MDAKPNSEFFRYAVSGIHSEYDEEVRQAAARRDEKIEKFRAWWIEKFGDSEEINAVSPSEHAISGISQEDSRAAANGSAKRTETKKGQTVPQKVVWGYVDSTLADPSVEIISQTVVRERVVRDYPEAKLPSIRSAIANRLTELHKQGKLELVEEARGGEPNKFRRTEAGHTEFLPKLAGGETSIKTSNERPNVGENNALNF